MRFIIKKLKGETLMLELLPGIEEREKPGRKPAKITDMGTPIFERIHARTMAAIDKSIEEANFILKVWVRTHQRAWMRNLER